MDARRFINFMPYYHHEWAAAALGMEHNTGNSGPDLTYNDGEGDRCCVELKWALVPEIPVEAKYPKAWTVDEGQIDYPKTYGKGYWGVGLYTLDRPVRDITDEDLGSLDDLVTSRELWLIRWNWIDKYSPSSVSGKTQKSEWSTQLRKST
jgi:hypothetical protein